MPLHSVLFVTQQEKVVLQKFYGARETSSYLAQAQWVQTLRELTHARWAQACQPGGEQVAVSGATTVVYTGAGGGDKLLLFLAGSDEYDELTLLEVVRAILEALRSAFGGAQGKVEQITEATMIEHYHTACLVLDEMINDGVLEQ